MAIAAAAFLAYLSNGYFLTIGDAMPNAFGAARIMESGSPTFTPEDSPFMFVWNIHTPSGIVPGRILRWDQKIGGKSAREWRDAELLTIAAPDYYLRPARVSGVYAGIYGPMPAISAVPVFAISTIVAGNVTNHPASVFTVAKLSASALAAGSVLFVFLAACRIASTPAAAAVAISYAFGTSIWCESSQCLWQQTTHLFFLSLGSWLLLALFQQKGRAWAVGLAFGAAAATRPTGGFVLLVVAVLLCLRARKELIGFSAGAAAVLAMVGLFQLFLFGTLRPTGQLDNAELAAAQATGIADVWQTPLWLGAAGMLLSPSRGLFILSPFLAFAGWGAWRSWKDQSLIALRALSVALGGMLLLSFKWYLWWGGPCFGPRMITDTLPLFALLLAPVADLILQRRLLRLIAGAMLAWSIMVQFVGAFAFEPSLWNSRVSGYEVSTPEKRIGLFPDRAAAEAAARAQPQSTLREVREDISDPAYRHRLWSVSDNQIFYFMAHFSESREIRRTKIEAMLRYY